jgi:hypothetical protein
MMFGDSLFDSTTHGEHPVSVFIMGISVSCQVARFDRDYDETSDRVIPNIVEFTGYNWWYRLSITFRDATIETFRYGAAAPISTQRFASESELKPALQVALDDHVRVKNPLRLV